jgi:hypothetical protein
MSQNSNLTLYHSFYLYNNLIIEILSTLFLTWSIRKSKISLNKLSRQGL